MNEVVQVSDNILREMRRYYQILRTHFNKYLVKGIHGSDHLLRVTLYSILLCDYYKVEEREIVCVAALFHDIGRINDVEDVMHGIRSWTKAKEYIEEIYSLSEEKMKIIKFLIQNHCLKDNVAKDNVALYHLNDKEHGLFLLKILRDSDSLDMIRTTIFCDTYLQLEYSKKLITYAAYINNLINDIMEERL